MVHAVGTTMREDSEKKGKGGGGGGAPTMSRDTQPSPHSHLYESKVLTHLVLPRLSPSTSLLAAHSCTAAAPTSPSVLSQHRQ